MIHSFPSIKNDIFFLLFSLFELLFPHYNYIHQLSNYIIRCRLIVYYFSFLFPFNSPLIKGGCLLFYYPLYSVRLKLKCDGFETFVDGSQYSL